MVGKVEGFSWTKQQRSSASLSDASHFQQLTPHTLIPGLEKMEWIVKITSGVSSTNILSIFKHPIWSKWTKVHWWLMLKFDAQSLICRLITIARPEHRSINPRFPYQKHRDSSMNGSKSALCCSIKSTHSSLNRALDTVQADKIDAGSSVSHQHLCKQNPLILDG